MKKRHIVTTILIVLIILGTISYFSLGRKRPPTIPSAINELRIYKHISTNKNTYEYVQGIMESLANQDPMNNCQNWQVTTLGNISMKWLPTPSDAHWSMQLIEDFILIDSDSNIWIAREQDIINGANIPAFLWSFVGSPFVGSYRRASIIHDVYIEDKERLVFNINTGENYLPTDADKHRMFYEMSICDGTQDSLALAMYAAIKCVNPIFEQVKEIANPAYLNISSDELINLLQLQENILDGLEIPSFRKIPDFIEGAIQIKDSFFGNNIEVSERVYDVMIEATTLSKDSPITIPKSGLGILDSHIVERCDF